MNNKQPNQAIKTGDFFYSTWGYEQTNVSFYIVTAVTAKSVKIAEVKSVREARGSNHGVVTPTNQIIGKEFMRKLNDYVKINSVEYAKHWDGRPKCYSSTY